MAVTAACTASAAAARADNRLHQNTINFISSSSGFLLVFDSCIVLWSVSLHQKLQSSKPLDHGRTQGAWENVFEDQSENEVELTLNAKGLC